VQSSSQFITVNKPALGLYTQIDKLARTARFFQQRKLTSVLSLCHYHIISHNHLVQTKLLVTGLSRSAGVLKVGP